MELNQQTQPKSQIEIKQIKIKQITLHSQQKSKQSSQNQQGLPVYANIYHFWSGFNWFCGCCGLGVYHTGIQLDGVQYMYYGFNGQQTGVIGIHPLTAAYIFQQKILLGYTNMTYYQLHATVLQPLQKIYIGNKYDLLQKNCNHFARDMSQKLNLQQKFPSRAFRITNCLNYLRCCIPNCILNGRLDWFNFQSEQQQQQVLDEIDNYEILPDHQTQSHRIKQTDKK